jgi:hypothetical protein
LGVDEGVLADGAKEAADNARHPSLAEFPRLRRMIYLIMLIPFVIKSYLMSATIRL